MRKIRVVHTRYLRYSQAVYECIFVFVVRIIPTYVLPLAVERAQSTLSLFFLFSFFLPFPAYCNRITKFAFLLLRVNTDTYIVPITYSIGNCISVVLIKNETENGNASEARIRYHV